MGRAGVMLAGPCRAALLALSALCALPFNSAFAQTAVPSSLAAACRVRVSVLENYSPFQPAVAAGNKLLAASASGDIRGALGTFDRALAAVLDTVPNEEAAVFALKSFTGGATLLSIGSGYFSISKIAIR